MRKIRSFIAGFGVLYFHMILTGSQIHSIRSLNPRQSIMVKADLGHSELHVRRTNDGYFLNDSIFMNAQEISDIRLEEDALYYLFIENKMAEIMKLQLYDDHTGQYYRLVNCGETVPPTVEISGVKMHVTMDQDPKIDTLKKIGSFTHQPGGNVLDTCCGLGYTSIRMASLSPVSHVTVIERDPNIIQLCRLNPFSLELFSNKKISLIHGNSAELIPLFPNNHFNFIIHDPPRFALSPELYSLKFYKHLFRILRSGGEIYHYTGNPNKGQRKQSLQSKTLQLMHDAGFTRVKKAYQGVWAKK